MKQKSNRKSMTLKRKKARLCDSRSREHSEATKSDKESNDERRKQEKELVK